MIIIKVTILKIGNFKSACENDLIFQQNNREVMEICLRNEKNRYKNVFIKHGNGY